MVVRLGMAALGVLHAWWGLWATLAPSHFYETFPGFGRRWTADYPPYNAHLVADLGATFLTLAFLLFAGAAAHSRPVRTVALTAVGVFGALHLGFHSVHRGGMDGADFWTSLFFLVLGVLAPIALLVLDRFTAGKGSGARRVSSTGQSAE